MADETNTTVAPDTTAAGTPTTPATVAAPATPAKEKTVIDDMDARRIVANPEEAVAYLGKCMSDFPDFGNYPVAAPGVSVNAEGGLDFDPDVYGTEGTRVMIAVLTQRGDGPGTSTVKAIVIAPVPTLDLILANPQARDWAARILEKELNHVAVRQLRKAENIADAVDSMPKTLDDYITSDRAAGGILQAYEELWRPIKNNMGKLSRSWRLANLSKKELRRSLESKSYAGEYYPTLEEAKQGSLFVFALQGLIDTAKKNGLDPTIFQRWLDGRDEAKIDIKAEDEDEEFSLDALTAAMQADPSGDSTTTETGGTPPTTTGAETPETVAPAANVETPPVG